MLVENPADRFALQLGIFDAGRGASDTIFNFLVTKAGIYPFRLVWENGTGGANVEWFSVTNGTKILINDTNANAIKVYQAGPALPAFISPAPGSGSLVIVPDKVTLKLTDTTGSTVDPATVKVTFNGAAGTNTATKATNTTTIVATPASALASGSTNTLSLTYNTTPAQAAPVTRDITVVAQPTPRSQPPTPHPRPRWIRPSRASTSASIRRRSPVGLSPIPWFGPKINWPGKHGANIATKNTDGTYVYVEPAVINYDATGTGANGNFTPDVQMPGFPGTDANQATDNNAAEITTVLDLPAGFLNMGVNSDDGFRLTIGKSLADLLPPAGTAIELGEFNAGRGASDTIFTFLVQQAGLYPARLIWKNGNGGANVEWFSVLQDGTKVLINDSANANAIKAYRVGPTNAPSGGTAEFSSVARSGNNLVRLEQRHG